jgi:hypothetical protein
LQIGVTPPKNRPTMASPVYVSLHTSFLAQATPFVHFSLVENSQFVCPEPYFTAAAQASIMTLLQNTFPSEPNLRMCYL